MPTLAAPERALSLRRAIVSALDQDGVQVVPIVVVNGPTPDPAVMAELEANPRVRVCRLERASLPAALRVGRDQVDSPWFAELDDDDVLLPGGLAVRLQALQADPDLHVVVTNGYRRCEATQSLNIQDGDVVRRDPLRALLRGNWLLPGSWLCRTDRVGPGIFDAMPPYLECTYLAIRFALTGRMRFLDVPTVAWTMHGGESGSNHYALGQPDALRQILSLELPRDVRSGLTSHLTAAYHSVAERHRSSGDLPRAWSAHLRCLKHPSGWRFLPYTRHLVRASLRRAFSAR
jgi:hypothetical protein